ncbi:hypothetical protein BLNAU_9423 [Blattamonas nauphoetae]|uniref:Uncharacterized protein n=1 Tax=Blattamonas nauphoetae TaxID=2049346 RepID=A0ABQ9XVS5_9EUKA|nr:hypothetical protein BLNAU_9423 [Blattamonas nauphoetae]
MSTPSYLSSPRRHVLIENPKHQRKSSKKIWRNSLRFNQNAPQTPSAPHNPKVDSSWSPRLTGLFSSNQKEIESCVREMNEVIEKSDNRTAVSRLFSKQSALIRAIHVLDPKLSPTFNVCLHHLDGSSGAASFPHSITLSACFLFISSVATTFTSGELFPFKLLKSFSPFVASDYVHKERSLQTKVCSPLFSSIKAWSCLALFIDMNHTPHFSLPQGQALIQKLHDNALAALQQLAGTAKRRVSVDQNRMTFSLESSNDLGSSILSFLASSLKHTLPSSPLITVLARFLSVDTPSLLLATLGAITSFLSSHASTRSMFFTLEIPFGTNKKGDWQKTPILDVLFELAYVHEHDTSLHNAILSLFQFCPLNSLLPIFTPLTSTLLASTPSTPLPSPVQSKLRTLLVAWWTAEKPTVRLKPYYDRAQIRQIPPDVRIQVFPVDEFFACVDVTSIPIEHTIFHSTWIQQVFGLTDRDIARRIVPTLIKTVQHAKTMPNPNPSTLSFFSIPNCLEHSVVTSRFDTTPSHVGELFAMHLMRDLLEITNILVCPISYGREIPRVKQLFLIAEGFDDLVEADLHRPEVYMDPWIRYNQTALVLANAGGNVTYDRTRSKFFYWTYHPIR